MVTPPSTPQPAPTAPAGAEQASIEILERWQQLGATWRIVDRTSSGVTISLCRCDDGEEAQRMTSADPELLGWLGDRTSSDEVCPD